MKSITMLGLAVVAMIALMVGGAGTASAAEMTCTNPPGTKVTCPTGTTHHQTSTHVVFHFPSGTVTCTHAVHTSTTTSMSSFSGTGSSSGCNSTVDVLNHGSYTVDSSGGSNGTVTSTGYELTVVMFGFHCILRTNNTSMGTLTGSPTTGGKAVLDISATIPRTGGSSGVFCGSTVPMTGTFTVTTPTWFAVDP